MDRVAILNGEHLDEELLAESFGRTGISDYVERNLRITENDVDFANAVADIPSGKAFVLENGRDMMLLPDARAGVELGTDGVQHVYICYDLNQPEGERIEFEVSASQTEPELPSLRIAAIDMADQEVGHPNHTAPIYRRDAETYKGEDIDSDGDGVVDRADSAAAADRADSADVADRAESVAGEDVEGPVARAGDADGIGGNVSEAVLAANLAAHGFNIGGVGAMSVEQAIIGAPNGLKIQGRENGNIDITPQLDGSFKPAAELSYLNQGVLGDPTWDHGVSMSAPRSEVGGGPGSGDGLLSRSLENGYQLVPKVSGSYRYKNAIEFELARVFNEPSYQLNGNVYAQGSLIVGGYENSTTGYRQGNGLLIRDANGTVQIAPKISGSFQFSQALTHDGDEWSTGGSGLEVPYISLNPDGDGVVIRKTSDGVKFTPVVDGEAYEERRWRYKNGRWISDGDFEVNGEKARLPRNDYDPDDAEVGDMWYRTDQD